MELHQKPWPMLKEGQAAETTTPTICSATGDGQLVLMPSGQALGMHLHQKPWPMLKDGQAVQGQAQAGHNLLEQGLIKPGRES